MLFDSPKAILPHSRIVPGWRRATSRFLSTTSAAFLCLLAFQAALAQGPVITALGPDRQLSFTPTQVWDNYSLQGSTNLQGPWQLCPPFVDQPVTDAVMTVQVPNLGTALQFFRIAENITNSWTFPPYTNVPEGFSGQTYLTNPVLTIRPDWDPGVARNITNGYLVFREGPYHPPQITDAQINTTMTRINGDLRYIIETLGLRNHPSTQSPNFKFINYYLLGSGLPGDSTPTNNTPETGYQGWRYYSGVWWPVVEMTYQDFLPPDDYHRWAVTHEFIHVLQAGYGVFGDSVAGWFNEAHNDYVIARLREGVAARKEVGWLDPYGLLGSYLPIECYAMLADGSASGPEGTYGNVNGNFGGYSYCSLFPLFLSQRTKMFFNNALWEQATPTESVLQTLTRVLGAGQARQVLIEYGARNAILDYLDYAPSLTTNMRQQWSNGSGNWFYTATTNQGGWLTPADPMRLPRHTGRNNIPITLTPGASRILIEFVPDATGSKGSASDLRAQIAFRDSGGQAIFSRPVAGGTCALNLTSRPSNGVVILVITNVKLNGYVSPAAYGWDPSETFGYKVRIIEGGTPAPTSSQYF